jgi:hypothetical protein
VVAEAEAAATRPCARSAASALVARPRPLPSDRDSGRLDELGRVWPSLFEEPVNPDDEAALRPPRNDGLDMYGSPRATTAIRCCASTGAAYETLRRCGDQPWSRTVTGVGFSSQPRSGQSPAPTTRLPTSPNHRSASCSCRASGRSSPGGFRLVPANYRGGGSLCVSSASRYDSNVLKSARRRSARQFSGNQACRRWRVMERYRRDREERGDESNPPGEVTEPHTATEEDIGVCNSAPRPRREQPTLYRHGNRAQPSGRRHPR